MLDSVMDDIFLAAKSGNGRAQYTLAMLYSVGYEGKAWQLAQDKVLSEKWIKKAAESGSIEGQRSYACLLWTRGLELNRLYRTCLQNLIANNTKDDSQWKILRRWLRSYKKDIRESVKWCRIVAERGDIQMCYDLACKLIAGDGIIRDIDECAKWLRIAAKAGFPKAVSVVSSANGDLSAARIATELHVSLLLRRSDALSRPKGIASDDRLEFETPKDSVLTEFGDDWLFAGKPIGSEIPPPSGRGISRTPKLQIANPSFAARLIAYVRDRFNGDAPSVYRAARVSRKTYSSIISNELRTVSKPTAIAFSFALRLSEVEMDDFLRAAGYALSEFLLEDIIVRACSRAGIYEIEKVNEILVSHGAKPLSC